MIIGDLIEKFIEYSGLHSFHTLISDMESMLEDEIDTFPLYRLGKYHRCIGEEVEFLRKIGHITIENGILSDIGLREDLVPLVQDKDDSFFGLESLSDDDLILMSHTIIGIDDKSDDISTLDRALSSHDTPIFDIPTSDLPRSTDTRGIDETDLLSLKCNDRIDRISSCSWHILHDRTGLS